MTKWLKKRDVALQNLGFSSYKDYLKSSFWHEIRDYVMTSHDNKCFICDKKADCVHHQDYSYKTLSGDDISYLYPLCNKCHHKIEFAKSGKKKSFTNAKNHFEQVTKLKPSRNIRKRTTKRDKMVDLEIERDLQFHHDAAKRDAWLFR